MNCAVRYFTRAGSTKKLADAIAEEMGVKAQPLTEPLKERVDLLFLGSSLYKFGYDPAVGEFLKKNAQNIGMLAIFGSSASGGSCYEKLAAYAKTLNIPVCEEHFACFGHFLMLHKDRPNASDLEGAAAFASKVAGR